MELIQPGIGLGFWMLLSFSLLIFLLAKFAWKPIVKMLKDREDAIDDALNAAEKAREEIKDLHGKNEELLRQAREERDDILMEARKMKDKIIEEATQKASEEGQRMLENAKQSIHFEKMQAITELKNEVASLSTEIAEQILKHELSDKKRSQDIIAEMVDKIKLN